MKEPLCAPYFLLDYFATLDFFIYQKLANTHFKKKYVFLASFDTLKYLESC